MAEHGILFAVGLGLLAVGSGALVAGAARLDRATGRGAFAVGLVAIGLGPCVSGFALALALVIRSATPLEARRLDAAALATVIGGNIASSLLVLGVAAFVRPATMSARLFGTTIPLLFTMTLLFWFLAADKAISRPDAAILLMAAVGSLVLLARAARREPPDVRAALAGWVPERMPVWVAVLLSLTGLAGVASGAWLAAGSFLQAAVGLRLSTPVTGMTLAAFGTALPALVAAVLAVRRGRPDVALGLAVGPPLFNVSLVVGAVALVRPLLLTEHAILYEVPAMVLSTALVSPALINGRVPRWEGALLFAAYIGFVTWQVLRLR
ncbi:hypothetical protein R5W24_002940 [Gemmata sp. JC717]|uniref:sodium:calcium antiporter n=1 Tax=Gemmata algarum TaxID=2975278 RepID=UPI0021BB4F10|nr:hypothetical protein [Gemmata algarum]MDY3553826.1 hypothetical protein [Gemmata algarum]